MLLVEFTYQDYLKYEKFLERKEQKEKENNFIKFTDKDTTRFANLLMKLEKLIDKDFNYIEIQETEEKNELKVMEENTPYVLEKNKQEESRKKHDELFRSLLNNKEEFVNFIKYFVDPTTNLTKEKIQKYNRSFITSKYQSRTSDIVYKEKGKKIYYLIEHQSSVDYDMPYRMLEYSYEIIQDTVEKEKAKSKNYEYPKVIPIVLYTGNKKWKVPKVIGAISDGIYKDVGLSLKYILIDTNNYSREQLLSSKSIVGQAMIADRSSTDKEVFEAIEKMIIENPNKSDEILEIIDYVFKGRLKENELENLKKQIKEGKVEEIMITVRERLEENDKKILAQGIAQGIAQERSKRINIAKNLLNMGMKKEEVHRITGLNMKEIEELI